MIMTNTKFKIKWIALKDGKKTNLKCTLTESNNPLIKVPKDLTILHLQNTMKISKSQTLLFST